MKLGTIFWIKNIIIFIALGISILSFYQINALNYEKQKEIQQNVINHPDSLPETHLAEITSIGFKNLKADWYWLQAVQYIGGNALESEYKKYLFEVLDLITDLNPYFEKPYIVGQLLIPSYNQRYESLSQEEQDRYVQQWVELGLKWVENFCDMDKVNRIVKEESLTEVWQNETYKNPCKSYAPAYYLAFIYHFYLDDSLTASDYYKIAAANDDSPEGAKTLAAIMQWKWGNREKSTLMFLWLAKEIEPSDEVCTVFANELDGYFKNILSTRTPLDGEIISGLQNARDEIFWEFTEEKEEEFFWDTKCANFVHKAIREINLAYIEAWNERFREENPWKNIRNAKFLFEDGYIDFLPTDVQQYWEYWIIYEYSFEKWKYDYTMWSYD